MVDLALWWRYLETRWRRRPREYSRNSTEFKFVFKSYSGVVARTTDLVALMSSMFKMRTGTSDRSAAESWLIPMKCGWDNGKNKEQEEKGNENPKSGLSSNCRKWGVTAMPVVGMEKRNRFSPSSKQFVVYAGGHRCRHKRVGRENAEESLLGMVVGFITIKQFSVDFVTSVHVCPKSYATYASLSLKVWSMREVVSNEMNLHGEVFTVKVFAVVCEGRRRQLLSRDRRFPFRQSVTAARNLEVMVER